MMRNVRVLAAVVLGAAMLSYAAVWVYYTQQHATAFLGVVREYDGWSRRIEVHQVTADGPAARAGVRAGDAIVAVNGIPLDSPGPFDDAIVRGAPGDAVRLTLTRKGTPGTIDVEATLAEGRERSVAQSRPQRAALTPLMLYPVPAVAVALVVLALRTHDLNAWLLALVFAGLGVGPPETVEAVAPPPLRSFLLGYTALFSGMAPALFYALMARFPASSALDWRVPWLKWLLGSAGAVIFIPFAASILLTGSQWAALRTVTPAGVGVIDRVSVTYSFLGLGLGLLSLLLNCRPTIEAEARRRARLVAWSFAVGLVPWMALTVIALLLRRGLFDLPFWLWVPPALLMMLVPVLFGYAVVKHRVMEFSVLVRRSARYVLVQRGFVVLALLLSVLVTVLFVLVFSRVIPRLTDAALPASIVAGTAFGLVLLRTAGAVSTRVTRRIDRAFFRNAYDARVLLEELAQRIALVESRDQLAGMMSEQLREALHPRRLDVFLRDRAGALAAFAKDGPGTPEHLELSAEAVERFEARGQASTGSADPEETPSLSALGPECVVPMLNRRRKLLGMLVLGPRLSEEPYSREDQSLLTSVASHAGGALENLLLAEEMAERIEAERRTAQELQIAAAVQRRLLPTHVARLATAEYIGHCVQARSVGGDYYDFLDLGRGQLGIVLADVSGKGLYAALLMAHLQASIRSLSARLVSEDLTSLLVDLNRSFGSSTAGNHFATLFFGHYDDDRRRLQYVNCGHQPPFLLRAGGGVERLPVSAGAVGLFDEWSGSVERVDLDPGDVLAVFSDGVTEAMNPAGDEFGEARLLEALSAHRGRPLSDAVERVVAAVRVFGGPEQSDDLTLVLVRAC